MKEQVPNITAVASAIVLLANMFLGTSLVEEETQQIIGAIVVLVLAGASIWSWFQTRGLIARNTSLTAQLTPSVARKKNKKK